LTIDQGQLPPVPGGWKTASFDLGYRTLELMQPADPDVLLDDPDVLEANRRDDYMPYWSYLWPAAGPMARALAHAGWPPGTPILELGSGIGLVGLAALACGWDVTFSDYDDSSLQLCRLNAVRNGLPDPRLLKLDWRQPHEQRFPVILGCEVIYERRNHDPILDLIDRMLTAGGVCWIGDPGRSQAPRFLETAAAHGWDVTLFDGECRPMAAYRQQFCIFALRRLAS
jgi:predicted nicotinamide N-methyase